jgi:hypothetical protein
MQDFPSNSQKAKAPDAPREELKPVTSAQARERKNGIGRKFKRATQQARTLSRQARAQHNLADLVIPTRSEAESVIDRMYDIMSRDGMVTVADLYVLTNVRPDMTDVKWGWTNLRGARAVGNERRGYMLSLPEPEALG